MIYPFRTIGALTADRHGDIGVEYIVGRQLGTSTTADSQARDFPDKNYYRILLHLSSCFR